jgi:hypothetical protein
MARVEAEEKENKAQERAAFSFGQVFISYFHTFYPKLKLLLNNKF